jgi:hypothetical protein
MQWQFSAEDATACGFRLMILPVFTDLQEKHDVYSNMFIVYYLCQQCLSAYNKWTPTYLQSASHFKLLNILVVTNFPFFITSLADINWIYQSHFNWRRPPLVPNCNYPDIFAALSLSLSLYPVAPTWRIGYPWNALFHFSFLILKQSVGLLGRGISQSQDRYLHWTTQTQNRRTQTSMPWVGFEPTIPVFERAKTAHALDRAAAVIGRYLSVERNNTETD